jgi:hypothetical protein
VCLSHEFGVFWDFFFVQEMECCCWFKVLVQKETIPRIRGFLFSISVSVGSMHTVLPTGTLRDLRVYMCTLKVVPISNESYLHSQRTSK